MRLVQAIIILLFISAVNAQTLPSRQSVLDNMLLANNYFKKKWPDPTANIVTDKTRPSNLWTRGTYYEGMMQLYYLTKDTSLYNYAVKWGTYHKWQPTYVGTTVTRIADNQCCGQTYIELYNLDPKAERISTMKASIDAMVNSTKVNDWWWIDALHMAMPVFAKLGVLYNDSKYYDKMYNLYNYTKSQAKGVGLYNKTEHLWYRDSVYLPPKITTNGLPVYWSRGNGWVFAALVRTLDVIPVTALHRDEYLTVFKEMAEKLITIQRTDGFWNSNLGDANDYGGKESSGTVFFTYGLAWGINHGVLDSATYYLPLTRAWNGLITDALHTAETDALRGAIGYMQSSGSQPSDGQPLSYAKLPNFEDFGLGGFLLAGSEVYKLAKANGSTTENDMLIAGDNITAYPNPFSSSICLNFNSTSVNPELFVYNQNGQLVYSKKLNGNKTISWNGVSSGGELLNNGVYLISIQDGNKTYKSKIILKR